MRPKSSSRRWHRLEIKQYVLLALSRYKNALPRSRAFAAGCLGLLVAIAPLIAEPAATAYKIAQALVPGVVVDHSPSSTKIYIGSPSIAILPNGKYVASHDFFGPKTQYDTTVIFISDDHGVTWRKLSTLSGQFWSTLFVIKNDLYLMGTDGAAGDGGYGNVVIRRSSDEGRTWTNPKAPTTGRLKSFDSAGDYHTAPVPIIIYRDRVWRAVEWRAPRRGGPINYNPIIMSAPLNSDLLDARNWSSSRWIGARPEWLDGKFAGWLEGNVVVDPSGRVVDILRAAGTLYPEVAAKVVLTDKVSLEFDPNAGFVSFPGGGKKFTIRYDPASKLYWSLSNWVTPIYSGLNNLDPIRNTLVLTSSPDLETWSIRSVLLHHDEYFRHGFQYADWQFDGADIIAVVRTAFDDANGGASSSHDANFLTFHRFRGFRELKFESPGPLSSSPLEKGGLKVDGGYWQQAKLGNGTKAYSNREYVWENVPPALNDCTYTQTSGGLAAKIRVVAYKDTSIYIAVAQKQKSPALVGWFKVPNISFGYSDAEHTRMDVYTRSVHAGEEILLPAPGWSGCLLLLPESPL